MSLKTFLNDFYSVNSQRAADSNGFERHEMHTMNPKGVRNSVSDQSAAPFNLSGRRNAVVLLGIKLLYFSLAFPFKGVCAEK